MKRNYSPSAAADTQSAQRFFRQREKEYFRIFACFATSAVIVLPQISQIITNKRARDFSGLELKEKISTNFTNYSNYTKKRFRERDFFRESTELIKLEGVLSLAY